MKNVEGEAAVKEARWRKAWSYQVLGVPKTATSDEIDLAFAKGLAEANKAGDDSRRAELTAAREALKDPRERAKVDVLAYNLPLDMKLLQGMKKFCYPHLPPDEIDVLPPDASCLAAIASTPDIPSVAELISEGKHHELTNELPFLLEQARTLLLDFLAEKRSQTETEVETR